MQSNYMEYLAEISICAPALYDQTGIFQRGLKNMIKFFTLHFLSSSVAQATFSQHIVSFEKEATN